MRTFAARYDGRCSSEACTTDGTIREGDEVAYVDDELMHESCASREFRPPTPLCSSCFEYHKGECA